MALAFYFFLLRPRGEVKKAKAKDMIPSPEILNSYSAIVYVGEIIGRLKIRDYKQQNARFIWAAGPDLVEQHAGEKNNYGRRVGI